MLNINITGPPQGVTDHKLPHQPSVHPVDAEAAEGGLVAPVPGPEGPHHQRVDRRRLPPPPPLLHQPCVLCQLLLLSCVEGLGAVLEGDGHVTQCYSVATGDDKVRPEVGVAFGDVPVDPHVSAGEEEGGTTEAVEDGVMALLVRLPVDLKAVVGHMRQGLALVAAPAAAAVTGRAAVPVQGHQTGLVDKPPLGETGEVTAIHVMGADRLTGY